MVVLGVKWEGQAEQGNAELLPKTLNSFSGFAVACTNSADIYILWWIVKNKRSSSRLMDRAARMPEVLYLPWCLASYPLPSVGPLPLRYPADLHAVLSAPPHSPGSGPHSLLWERLGRPGALAACQSYTEPKWMGLTSVHVALRYRTAGRTVKYRKSRRLEMIALYIFMHC